WRIAVNTVSTVAILFLCLPFGSNVLKADEADEKVVPQNTIVHQSNHAKYAITVEKDHMKIVLKYQLVAEKDQRERIDSSSIFIEKSIALPKGVELENKEGSYYLHFLKKG